MIVFPDYDRSIVNITSSLLAHYGAPTSLLPLPEVTRALSSRPRHVALVILDGLGEAEREDLLGEDAFLSRKRVTTLTSVFPSTTTAATTSLYTGLTPQEHGWIAWMGYFKEYARQVDLFLDRDSYSHVALTPSPAATLMPYESAFEKIHRATDGRVATRMISPFPPKALGGADEMRLEPDFSAACDRLEEIFQGEEKDFTILYHDQPDHTQHEKGVFDPEVKKIAKGLDARLQSMAGRMPEDALLLVTADHGLLNCEETVLLNDCPDIMDCLVMPPTMESRAASFFVKRGREAAFENAFARRFGDSFLLLKREEAFARGLFGVGRMHPKTDDFVGDYLAAAVGDKAIRYRPAGALPPNCFLGQHAGLTAREMRVPLAIVKGGRFDAR